MIYFRNLFIRSLFSIRRDTACMRIYPSLPFVFMIPPTARMVSVIQYTPPAFREL